MSKKFQWRKHMVNWSSGILQLMVANAALTTTQLAQGKPGCLTKCGDLQIPYPFDTETKCSLNKDFIITCNG
ncbi:hypothetical protein Dsin_023723 [Dipteronia sinensis]|uniref:Wall-associated receptor kinase galacturonan-binding domain-containing protein n=1 Tax=Dipteronia sinensis TaxID=43782 RepID=A0AAE0A3U8_9ROSI|nr:hypothetical protein Dsin_023723 [Dipteronia sinensis]